ncbi:MAG: sigma-70 family RNA polymerase sigma factor, partial [Candidatus Poribacteria bacterium]|nr:sigma-70 family RNA polymerase sigma factor [Candidatus Poribacteria bacterium]
MKHEDAQLVHRCLAGDESAFTTLVKKYQKRVHALAWRKVGDFHIAEELAQDTFLKAYQKLGTLKNPSQFAGWLYVITNRLCIAWHRKQKPPMESLETTSGEEIEEMSYRHYEDEAREKADIEHRRERVNALLEKLPESERTVVTLHYLGEMTSKAIGEFLGVSPNTVRSRLQRARNRLLKEQEEMIRETLGSVHLPTTFTENVVRQIADIKPASPSGSKPVIPVAVSAATAIFIFLMMGVGSQYLARFQRPYNLNAQSETTVEIIDAPIVLDIQATPDLRNQVGRFDTTGKSSGTGPQVSEPVMLAAAQVEKETRPSTDQQWIQASGPEAGGSVLGLLASSTGDAYAASAAGIYRLTSDASAWTLVNTTISTVNTANPNASQMIAMAARKGTLYLVSPDQVLVSTDSGETWESLGVRPEGEAIGLAITDEVLYLVLEDKGIFQSTDGGKQWTRLNDEVAGISVLAVAAIENTVFIGTTTGLYRIRSDKWEKLPVDTTKAIHSLAVTENSVYVGTGRDFSEADTSEGAKAYAAQLMSSDSASSWGLFHSTDLGDSWTDITPTSNSFFMKVSPGVKVVASGNTVLALGMMLNFRSTDAGKTWTEFGFDFKTADMNSLTNTMWSSMTLSMFPAIAVNENTIVKAGALGLTRSTDGGESWHPFMNGIVSTQIFNLVGFKNELYTSTATGVTKSTDGGETWEKLPMNSDELTLKPTGKSNAINNMLIFPKLAIAGGALYGISSEPGLAAENAWRIFRLSANGNVLVPIQGVPAFEADPSITDIMSAVDLNHQLENFPGAFAVSGEVFYAERKRQLLRWKRGASEWFNTGLIDTEKSIDDSFDKGFKLAVHEDMVYVGKRDGSLFQSVNGGGTWKDLTPNLPVRFERFNEIRFAGSTIYVATNAGVLTSKDGEHWDVITDTAEGQTVIDRMAVAGMTVYGAGAGGVYRLNTRSEWEQISP